MKRVKGSRDGLFAHDGHESKSSVARSAWLRLSCYERQASFTSKEVHEDLTIETSRGGKACFGRRDGSSRLFVSVGWVEAGPSMERRLFGRE
jgi:hypothetical protein